MSSVRDSIELIADVFLAAAHADGPLQQEERSYIAAVLCDLLRVEELPEELERRLGAFDPRGCDVRAVASGLRERAPMSGRRLLELTAYVTLADGLQKPEEEAFVHALGEALGLPREATSDLTGDRLRTRRSFANMARVRLPDPPSRK